VSHQRSAGPRPAKRPATTEPALALHAFLPASYANGPGRRAVVWVQGCTLACPGCFNPETHPRRGGRQTAVHTLLEQIRACDGIEGVTITGGEPLQQRRPVLELLHGIRRTTSLSTVVFSGFSWDDIQRMPDRERLLAPIDVLIAGRYHAHEHTAHALRGSANQSINLLSDRY